MIISKNPLDFSQLILLQTLISTILCYIYAHIIQLCTVTQYYLPTKVNLLGSSLYTFDLYTNQMKQKKKTAFLHYLLEGAIKNFLGFKAAFFRQSNLGNLTTGMPWFPFCKSIHYINTLGCTFSNQQIFLQTKWLQNLLIAPSIKCVIHQNFII